VYLPNVVVLCVKTKTSELHSWELKDLLTFPGRQYTLRMFGDCGSVSDKTSYPSVNWWNPPQEIADVILLEEPSANEKSLAIYTLVFTAAMTMTTETGSGYRQDKFPGWYCRVHRRSADGKYAFVEETGTSSQWLWTLEDVLLEWLIVRIRKLDFILEKKRAMCTPPSTMLQKLVDTLGATVVKK
jgi:hypothetical protein